MQESEHKEEHYHNQILELQTMRDRQQQTQSHKSL